MPALSDLVRRPRAFFARAAERPSLFGPVLVAGTLGATAVVRLLALLDVLGAVAEGFQGNRLMYALGRQHVSAPQDLVLASVLVLLLFFIGWVLATVVIYVVARYFDPDGSFRDLLVCVGWGQLPVLVPALVSTGYILFAVAQAPEITTEETATAWLEAHFEDTHATLVTDVLDPLFAVWVAYLWFLAAEVALDLTRRQALVCVAIPAVLQILNSLGGVFTITG